MPEIIRWEKPPPHGNTGKRRPESAKWDEIAAELRGRPGQWAVLLVDARPGTAGATVHRIKSGRLSSFAPAGSFEAISRSNGNGNTTVYARYVGGQS